MEKKKCTHNLTGTLVRQLFIGIFGRVILKWLLKIKFVRMWAGTSLLRKGTSAEVL